MPPNYISRTVMGYDNTKYSLNQWHHDFFEGIDRVGMRHAQR